MNLRRALYSSNARALSSSDATLTEVPEKCEVLVVGGGIIGVSVAYNLAKRGVKDVVLLERHKLTSGTTWHAAGLVGQMRATKVETELSAAAAAVYEALKLETGLDTGYKQCGSLTTAATRERLEVLKRNRARARSYGLEAEVLTPDECGALMTHDGHTIIKTDDLHGGLWSPTDLTMAFAKGARMRGVNICEGVAVDQFQLASIDQGRKRVVGVSLEDGRRMSAEKVVLCGGQWSRDVARKAGVNVPLHSCEHFYCTTAKMPGVYRDNDSFTYFREWGEGLLVGGFEPNARPVRDWTSAVPSDFSFGLLPDDLEHFYSSVYEPATQRVPELEDAEITSFLNGPEAFTPDNNYILGEAPEVSNFFSARNLRLTALHETHKANGAKFGQKFGWERVNYYAPGDDEVEHDHKIDSKPGWMKYAKAEAQHCRENVALFDVSSFAKLLVKGRDAEACMQRLCCGDVSVVDRAVYTGMLNAEGGGYESDCTVTKLGDDEFLVVSPTGSATRDDADWIRRHLTGDATLVDVSNQLAVLAVMGPESLNLLKACVTQPSVFDDFPFGASRALDIGHAASVRAQRITYVGELGFELYVPVESAAHAYRAWGHELDPFVTPFEAGLGFTIDWSKDFIGKDALAKLKKEPLKQRVVALHTHEEDLPIWGNEPVLRDGELVGNVTTANYAHSLGGQGIYEDHTETARAAA
ncbi:oxidoreductase [Aureococcus anophagefferens]|nr:oxidoreductase [Aureococcus anophagefferens]